MGMIISMPDALRSYHYSVYEHKLIGPDGVLYTRAFIVLKDKYGVIVRFTCLHNYLGIYDGKVYRPITADDLITKIDGHFAEVKKEFSEMWGEMKQILNKLTEIS